ncbi:MAG TPA: DUF4398 domain-containing protein [Bdellovibrionales bacterium]|nr:DUF4398 domain-containing protein [Bdellovibrionales bacterium]
MIEQARTHRFFGILALCLATVLGGCVTSFPIDEYNLARTAYEAARDADANRYAPALWYNAEEKYREGEKAYRDRKFDLARERFIETRTIAEQAENAARLARQKSGDAP